MIENSVKQEVICWTCGQKLEIETQDSLLDEKKLRFWIQNVGWHSAKDRRHESLLVFCSKECQKNAQKPNGTFKKHSPQSVKTIDIPKKP